MEHPVISVLRNPATWKQKQGSLIVRGNETAQMQSRLCVSLDGHKKLNEEREMCNEQGIQ